MKKITVLLADDHTIVRQGLRALLTASGSVEVIGEAQNGREAVALANKTRPDVVVMDVAMPLLNGCEATRQILKATPTTKVLAMSSYENDKFVLQMIEAGAAGYVLKHTAAAELLKAIDEAQKGKSFFSPAVAKRLSALQHTTSIKARAAGLTSRETEVLQLIAEGFLNKEIATQLDISIKTVEKHRQQVMDKLNLHDIAGLTRYAISRGMVERAMPLET